MWSTLLDLFPRPIYPQNQTEFVSSLFKNIFHRLVSFLAMVLHIHDHGSRILWAGSPIINTTKSKTLKTHTHTVCLCKHVGSNMTQRTMSAGKGRHKGRQGDKELGSWLRQGSTHHRDVSIKLRHNSSNLYVPLSLSINIANLWRWCRI